MNNTELVKYLNDLHITQLSIDWIYDIPSDIDDKYLNDSVVVMEQLDVDKHRWYETSIEVVKNDGGFIGVRSITDIKGHSSVEDLDYILKFYEMEEVLEPTYKIIQSK